jgi:hypothetical protein
MVVHCKGIARKHSLASNSHHVQIHTAPEHHIASTQFKHQTKDPIYPILRANPFPKVTDLFCRLPLPTLLYWPEATNLGDLMRLWVRPGVQIDQSFSFSWTDESKPDTSENKVICPPRAPISRKSDFRVNGG